MKIFNIDDDDDDWFVFEIYVLIEIYFFYFLNQHLNRKDTDFPSEFFQIAACFHYLPDRENKNILILRMRFNRKEPLGVASIETMVRNFFIYIVEKIVSQHPNQGFALIFDCWKASLSNVDIDMARFIINTLSNYYSGMFNL